MVALIFGQELIPLQELSEGWSASYGMWIRAAVLVGIVTHTLLIQATYLINDFRITMSQRLQLYAIMPAIVVALAMVVASNFVFPILFFILFVTPPFYLLLIVMLRVVIGSNDYRQMLKNRVQVVRCVRFVCAQTSTVFIFPVYEMLFNAAEGTEYQLPVILLLPVIKVAPKNLVLYFAKALDDMAPVEVIFTADYFNAIYVATSIKSSTSIAAISAITITDLSQTFIMLYGLQRRTATILSRLGQASDNPTMVIKRNCRMKPLYQLAFVLETQWSLVQCKMMLWMVITLCFRVTHFGVDFKFEFIRLGLPRFWVPQG
ncbi:hypothetical protein PI124_g7391 [Phytophthora idaei]|nr:hypothetical protein PI124_g7391 [Phytophthora idaei]